MESLQRTLNNETPATGKDTQDLIKIKRFFLIFKVKHFFVLNDNYLHVYRFSSYGTIYLGHASGNSNHT